jgi:hypothetical protein
MTRTDQIGGVAIVNHGRNVPIVSAGTLYFKDNGDKDDVSR